MEVEDHFGVRLPDEGCSRVYTVADLAALVIANLPDATGTCPTARAFFGLRTLLSTQAGIERKRIRPRQKLVELFGTDSRIVWKKLRQHETRLPRMVMSDRNTQRFSKAGIALTCVWIGGVAAVGSTLGVGMAIAVGIATVILGVIVFHTLAGYFKYEFPQQFSTVGDLARSMASGEMPAKESGERLLAEQRVLEEVRHIVAEQMALPLEKVRSDSDFFKDLNMG